MSRFGTSTGSYPAISTQTRTVEQKRSMLRKALVSRPNDPRIREALQETLTPPFIQRAAGRGVFISYHRSDEIFALDLDTGLRNAGVRVWMDTIDIAEGADWRTQVIAALRGCGAMLLILSKEMVTDTEAANEYQYFVDTGKIVIPALFETCDFGRFNLAIPPVDFRRDSEMAMRQLIRMLTPEATSF